MILNYSLKVTIRQNIISEDFTNEENLATQIIFYKFLLNLIENNNSLANNINTLVSTYKDQYLFKFVNLKNRYISYANIIKYIKNNLQDENLLTISEDDIQQIFLLYLDSTEVVDFSTLYFDEKMYSIKTADSKSLSYLNKLHNDVFIPIIEFYKTYYGKNDNDMKINSAELVQNNIGKRVSFSITDISPINIYNNIINSNIYIKYFKLKISYPYIEITNI